MYAQCIMDFNLAYGIKDFNPAQGIKDLNPAQGVKDLDSTVLMHCSQYIAFS